MRTSPSSSDAAEPPRRETEEALGQDLRRLQARVEKLERVASLISTASVWDYTAYDQTPGEEWLAIDRDHYQRIVDALAGVDIWSPWERPLERRLGDL